MEQDQLWRKSSYSNGSANGECVELGQARDAVLVRDTKQRHLGTARPVLTVPSGAWTTFTASLKK